MLVLFQLYMKIILYYNASSKTYNFTMIIPSNHPIIVEYSRLLQYNYYHVILDSSMYHNAWLREFPLYI